MKKNNKGFTLAELLIVVAIIAVLVAIAIPIFNSQLEKSREATDVANIRDAYAEIAVAMIDGGLTNVNDEVYVLGDHTAKLTAGTGTDLVVTVSSVKIEQKVRGSWAVGTPSVAGISVTNLPTGDTNNIVFTFSEKTNSSTGATQTYLSDISYT